MNKKSKKEEDCPVQVFQLAKTKWQKSVALEFHEVELALNELKSELRQIKWVIGSILIPIIFLILRSMM
jgi:DNA-binding HxlR family transcriptional regulator